MRMRSLDSNHDWNFGRGLQDYNLDQPAIAENIQTRLLSFKNDCFFDMNAGIDWMRLLGEKNTEAEIILNCRAVILGSYGAVQINTFDAVSSQADRHMNLSFNMDSIFSRRFSQSVEVIPNV